MKVICTIFNDSVNTENSTVQATCTRFSHRMWYKHAIIIPLLFLFQISDYKNERQPAEFEEGNGSATYCLCSSETYKKLKYLYEKPNQADETKDTRTDIRYDTLPDCTALTLQHAVDGSTAMRLD